MSEAPNPFHELEKRLERIEALIIANNQKEVASNLVTSDDNEVMSITEICGKGKLMSRPTFYKHVKSGRITLYKLGNRSFVSKKEFYKAFTPNNSDGRQT